MAQNEKSTKHPHVAVLFNKQCIKEGVDIFIPYCVVEGIYSTAMKCFVII